MSGEIDFLKDPAEFTVYRGYNGWMIRVMSRYDMDVSGRRSEGRMLVARDADDLAEIVRAMASGAEVSK